MKRVMLLITFGLFAYSSNAQGNELPNELSQYAKAAKNIIIERCSGWKDKSTYKVTYYSNEWSINSVTDRFKMKIKVSWDGRATGYTYYVTGYLSGDLDGCNAKFTRTDKSWSISCDEIINFGECLE